MAGNLADWPPVASNQPTLTSTEKETAYLNLVDMFVDIVDPEIIQMVLQNHNWNADLALEDIMMLANNSQASSVQNVNKTANAPIKSQAYRNGLQKGNLSISSSQSYNVPTNAPVRTPSKQTKPSYDKPQYKVPKVKKSNQTNQAQLEVFVNNYNFIKTARTPFDRAIILVKEGVKVMVIMRGVPGSGKSTLAKKVLTDIGIEPSAHRKYVFSTDDFFVHNKVYVFVPEMLSQAHLWNQRRVAAAIREEINPVIVDNTNTQAWEMRVYAEMAVSAGYDIEILEPDTWWFRRGSASELEKRNIHSVSKAKIKQMMERYEKNITPDMLLKQFNLQYPLSKAPPQPSKNCKWNLTKFTNHRNNKPKKKKSDNGWNPQSDTDNINKMFSSFKINPSKPPVLENEFSLDSQNRPESSCPPSQVSETSTTYSNITPSEFRTKLAHLGTDVSSSSKNGDMSNKFFDKSDTDKLFDDLVANSNSFLKSLTGYSKSSQIKHQQQSNAVFSGNLSCQGKNNFNFMAETKKLLEALNKPSSSGESLKQSNVEVINETQVNIESPVANMPRQEEEETLLLDKQNSNDLSTQDFPKESNLSCEEKINLLYDMTDYNIEEAVELNSVEASNSHSSTCETKDKTCERGLSWDYIVVSNENSFTYQRKESVPLGFPVISDDTKSNVNANNNIFQGEKAEHKDKTKDENAKEIMPDDVYESDCGSIGDEPCNITGGTDKKENVSLTNCLNDDSFCVVSEIGQFNPPKESLTKMNAEAIGEDENLFRKSTDTEKDQSEKLEGPWNKKDDSPLKVMINNLDILSPLNDTNMPSGIATNDVERKTKNDLECETNISSDDKLKTPSTCPLLGCSDKKKDSTDTNNGQYQPKPARTLKRPRFLINAERLSFNENDFSKYFENWNTVSNPSESWVNEKTAVSSGLKNETSALPQRTTLQRCRNKTVEMSTNTHYSDFNLANGGNTSDFKILIGNINNQICGNTVEVKPNIAGFLDKSTMTEEYLTKLDHQEISEIKNLFPYIPEKYIRDIVKKCEGDIHWAIDLLLDSEYNFDTTVVVSEDEAESSDSTTDDEEPTPQKLEIPTENFDPKPRSPSHELEELKKHLESSVVIDKNHYSDKVAQIVKRKHPEYLHMMDENIKEPTDENNQILEVDGVQGKCKTEGVKLLEVDCTHDGSKVTDDVDEEEGSSSSGSMCDEETEDDTVDLIMSNHLILQLQQKFSSSSMPKIAETTPIVKLPLSFARQLYGYIMDSLQADADQQQSFMDDMISKDEDFARLLQFEDRDPSPQLQEVMDMEIALAMHQADQEEWNMKANGETLAAKLSRKILLEKFPQADPKMLKEVLHAHNYSLSDTVAAVSLGLNMEPQASTRLASASPRPPKEEKEKFIIVSDEGAAAAPCFNPSAEAEFHREKASHFYARRIECLSQANELLRSGNKSGAAHYSEMAQHFRGEMEKSNTMAAACLFSNHKTGANTLDLHFLQLREASVILDMFLDEVVSYITDRKKRYQVVFIITGRGLRSVGGVSRIKPLVQRKLQGRGISYRDVNPGMLSAVVHNTTPLSYTL